MEEIRLQKYLSEAGIASRRKSEELILQGKIKVNGQVVTELGTKVNPEKDEVKYKDKLIKEMLSLVDYEEKNFAFHFVTGVCGDGVVFCRLQ